MIGIEAVDLPASSVLAQGAAVGDYLDCFAAPRPRTIGLDEFVAAFYATPLFRLERVVLSLGLKHWVSDRDVVALAQGAGRFAVWDVIYRDADQILLQDRSGATRSWLAVQDQRLLFGSGVRARGGQPSPTVRLLLPLHRVYARALLRAAVRRLG